MPVEQGPGDGVDHVGRGDEQHLGQVEVHLEVVVPEGVVLGRVEHLEQRRGRVAPEVGADLVHLVEQDDRVHRSRPPAGPAPAGRAGRRRRCAGARGSPPRPARRRGPPARTAARGRGPPTRRARSCPRPGGPDQGQDGAGAPRRRPGRGPARPAACARPGARGCAPSRRPGRRGPRRGCAAASATSRRSSDSMPQGSSRTVSSQVRIQPCSGLCSLVRSSVSISRSTAGAHVLGQLALAPALAR